MNLDSSVKVPTLNVVLAALVFLSSVGFLLVAIAVGYCAAMGNSFFYSDLIINFFPFKDFPYSPSIPDTLRGFARFLAGVFPALIVNAISYVVIGYLTVGKKRALSDLAGIANGFLYQLKNPFHK